MTDSVKGCGSPDKCARTEKEIPVEEFPVGCGLFVFKDSPVILLGKKSYGC